MDQGNVATTTSAGHHVRLALIFLASLFGLILLGFAFGSSPASADDGGPDDGGLVPAVAELAGGVVETVAPVATVPVGTVVTAAIPLADVPLVNVPLSPASTTIATVTDAVPIAGAAIGSLPTAPVVDALVTTIDTTVNSTIAAAVGTVIGTVGSALQALPVLTATATVGETATSSAVSVAGIISGMAHGLWLGTPGPFGTGGISASGPSLTSFTLPVAALGTGFLVLLFSRRLGLVGSTLPVSPVYETDTSPD